MISIVKGYAWDGPSGPAIDTASFMRGSMVHDALYQLMRDGYLEHSYRKQSDQLLQQICKEDGMWTLRAFWVYLGVRLFANPASKPSHSKQLLKAP